MDILVFSMASSLFFINQEPRLEGIENNLLSICLLSMVSSGNLHHDEKMGKFTVKSPYSKSMILMILILLACASCSFPSKTRVAETEEFAPAHSEEIGLETVSPIEEPQDTALPIPTTLPDLEINFENVNRLEPQVTIQEEPGWITNLTFSPDSRLIAGAAKNKELKIWRVGDGSLEKSLSGHNAIVTSVTFSPDGRYLASGSQDTSIIIWRVSDWSILKTLEAHESFVNSLAFSPDSKVLASGGEDRRVILWQVDHGEILHRLEEPILRVQNVVFSSDGLMVAAASAENRARVWRVETGELVWTLLGPNPIYRLAFSPDGSILSTGAWSVVAFSGEPTGPIIFWDMSDGSQIRQSSEMTVAFSLVFSLNGDLLFSGAEKNNSVLVWRVDDGTLLWELKAHQAKVTAVTIDAEGTRIASADETGKIILWGLPEN
jgi:WD40 repeat protein